MKYIKYILALIAVLVIIFLGKGMMTPSVSYESTITVNKPAKEAWAVMSDEEKMPNWINGFKRVEPVSGEANTVGAVSNVFVEDNGEEMMMTETITAIETHKNMAMTFSMDLMDMDYEMIFEETDGNTNITTKSTVKGNGIIAKSMISFMGGAMKEQEDKNLTNLKNIIDENTKNYFPEPEPIVDTTTVVEDSASVVSE